MSDLNSLAGDHLVFSQLSNTTVNTASTTAPQFTATSDGRLKEDVTTATGGLKLVKNLRGVRFQWADANARAALGTQVGVIAQEVQQLMPGAVRTEESGFLSVDYAQLTAVLIESVKELAAQMEDNAQIAHVRHELGD